MSISFCLPREKIIEKAKDEDDKMEFQEFEKGRMKTQRKTSKWLMTDVKVSMHCNTNKT